MVNKRLDSGGRINRLIPLTFTFNGKSMQGFEGDTLASALLANNVNVVARSFKYGRPRGIVACGAEEPNAIVQLGEGAETVPNMRATQVELYEGLVATSTSGWPSLDFDVMGLFGIFGRLMPPGFYYKTFMRPKRLWMTYEKFIRKAAGLGKSPQLPDPDSYDKLNHHCDVLVVGAGPAGLIAALTAARTGARVILADEQSELGGSLLSSNEMVNGQGAMQWVDEVIDELKHSDNVLLLPRSTCFGYYDHNFLNILERRTDHISMSSENGSRQRMHRVRAKQVVLATGAIERPLVFANNDLPGVMLASAVGSYAKRYGVMVGKKLLLFTTNDNAYQLAFDWQEAGGEVVAIVESRDHPGEQASNKVKERELNLICGHAVIEAKGRKRVEAALIASISELTNDK